jgi:hypothetical protein
VVNDRFGTDSSLLELANQTFAGTGISPLRWPNWRTQLAPDVLGGESASATRYGPRRPTHFGRSGLGAQSDLIGTPEPMGIASAIPAPNGYLLACVIVLVTQGNQDRPARPGAEHPAAEWCCGGRAAAAGGAGAGAPARATPAVHRPADGINNECPVEYQGVLGGSLLP